MKVILLADVKGTGKKGDVIEVSDGYGKNFLIKKGLAKAGTASNVHEAEQKKAAASGSGYSGIHFYTSIMTGKIMGLRLVFL